MKNFSLGSWPFLTDSGQRSSPESLAPPALKLSLSRLDLLFDQNLVGMIAVVANSVSYVLATRGDLPTAFLGTWFAVINLSAVARLFLSIAWKRRYPFINSASEIRNWKFGIQFLLLMSGCAWGVIGALFPLLPTLSEQVLTLVLVLGMSAGALAAYSSSLVAMYAVLFPAMLPWIAVCAIQGESSYFLMAGLGIFYVILMAILGRNLNDYIDRFLKLNLENEELTENLKQQMLETETAKQDLKKSEEGLRIALEASGSATLNWDLKSDICVIQGNLSSSIGMDTTLFVCSYEDYLHRIHPEDRDSLRSKLKILTETGFIFDVEYRLIWPDGSIHHIADRGRIRRDEHGRAVRLTSVCWDITEKKNQESLRTALEVQAAANRAKSIFLANVSHEIRTPLAAINGFTEVLLKRTTPHSEIEGDLEIILRNGKYLISLVNDLLDLSKIETGQLYVERGRMAPIKEIEDAVLVIKSALNKKNLALDIKYCNQIPSTIVSDATRFRQILINLLSNAVKFTHQGMISISVYYDDFKDILRVVVVDTGIGMGPETARNLFEPFVRGTSPEVQRVQGSGLGLALSQNLARLLGGDLRLVQTAPGAGSTFEFVIRAEKAPETINAALSRRGGADRGLSQRLSGLHVLIVDDSPDLRELLRRYLLKQGATVEHCTNGKECLDLVQNNSFDIVLMDIKMPVMDGYEATTLLRKGGCSWPIIALTAHASAEDRELCLQAGCDDYISKPIDSSQLIETLLKHLGRPHFSIADITGL